MALLEPDKSDFPWEPGNGSPDGGSWELHYGMGWCVTPARGLSKACKPLGHPRTNRRDVRRSWDRNPAPIPTRAREGHVACFISQTGADAPVVPEGGRSSDWGRKQAIELREK